MRRIASGVVDQYVYFYAGQVGLTPFTVYRSRNGGASAAMTTPTINETDATNMPGVYELLLDEDMTLATNNITEQMVFFVTAPGMEPQFIEVELYDPANYSVDVASLNGTALLGTGTAADKWRGE